MIQHCDFSIFRAVGLTWKFVVVVVVVVFTLNRSLYPTTSAVPPMSFLIFGPRESTEKKRICSFNIAIFDISISSFDLRVKPINGM